MRRLGEFEVRLQPWNMVVVEFEYGFYTAKDFPVASSNTSMQRTNMNPVIIPTFFVGTHVHRNPGFSQGFHVEINDMHGRPNIKKHTRVKPRLLESTDQFYRVYLLY